MYETTETIRARLQSAAPTLLHLERQLELATELSIVRKDIAQRDNDRLVKRMKAHRLSEWVPSFSRPVTPVSTELQNLKAREESLVAALDLDAVHEVNDIETVIRTEIDSLYESLFEPLPFGIFAKEDALRLQGQEANSALLRNRAILEELNQATPLLQQASNALESVCGHDGDGLNASHETLSSLILADTALHAAWSHLTDASFISDVSELPDLNFSSPCPQDQVSRIAAELQPAVAFLIESTQEYTVNINNELVRGAAVVAEIESRLQRERRRLVLECAGADDDARLRDMPPGYEDHVGGVPTAAPPGYDHSDASDLDQLHSLEPCFISGGAC
ncbi:hypothetical protein HDU90_006847 [Geranomyces variabilis]|nr:hypothetical protein HDU90_006847 [Geranomyces variabilis]